MSTSHVKNALTRNQARAIKALLENKRVEDAADVAGVCTRTLYRWLELPVFTQALRAAEGAAIGDAVRSLVVDLRSNHDVMRCVRDDPEGSRTLKLRAAGMLDASLLRWRELLNIEQRLEKLEEAIYER